MKKLITFEYQKMGDTIYLDYRDWQKIVKVLKSREIDVRERTKKPIKEKK